MTTKTLSRCNVGDLIAGNFFTLKNKHGYVAGPRGLVKVYQPTYKNFITYGLSSMLAKEVDVIQTQPQSIFRFDKVTAKLPVMGLVVGIPYEVTSVETDHVGLKMVEVSSLNNRRGVVKVPAAYLIRMPEFMVTRYNNNIEQLTQKITDLWSKKQSL